MCRCCWAAPAAFGPPTSFPAGAGPTHRSVAVGDFNGDGDPDLAIANFNSNDVSVLLGGPGGSFGPPTSFPAGVEPGSVAVGDFNGDGDPDLATTNHNPNDVSDDPNDVSVLLGGPGGSFGPPSNFAAGDTPGFVAVGDFDGDGDPDLAVANINSNDVSVLLGGPGGSFGPPANFAAGGPTGVAVADFNGDGDPDLAVLARHIRPARRRRRRLRGGESLRRRARPRLAGGGRLRRRRRSRPRRH